MFFNKFVKDLNPYKVSTHKAWERVAKADVLKLDWNESTVPPSPLVRKALSSFAEQGLMNWYPDVDNSYLRSMLAEYCSVQPDNVEYFGSSDALHEYIIRTFINVEDTITMIAPTYDNFRAAAESMGANIDYFLLSSGDSCTFSFDFTCFQKHIEEVVPKIVYLCNPNNPTGTVYQVDEIEKMLRRFNDVLFIIDEAYFEFTGISAAKLAPHYENIVVCRTFSKAFGLASFRVGYAIASSHNIEGLRKVRNPKNISSYAQLAAVAALSDISYMHRYVEEVTRAKSYFVHSLTDLGVKVVGYEGGNFVLINFGTEQQRITDFFEEKNIFIRNYGHVTGMSGYTRITIGTMAQMEYVLQVLKDAL